VPGSAAVLKTWEKMIEEEALEVRKTWREVKRLANS
jgi:hypothetical protein